MNKSPILKIAHRGFISRYPDNSLPAFKAAIQEGFDMIEMDLQLTRKNEIILFHDRHMNGYPIESYSYEEIKRINSNVILLKDFFFNFPNYKNMKLYFDLKGKEELAVILKNYIEDNNINTNNLYIGSFNINHLTILNNIGAKLGFITCSKYTIPQYCNIIRKLHFLSVDKNIIDNDIVKICKGLNKKLFIFTCKNEIDKHYIKLFDVDGIVSNIKL
jgi:glycerophosphoryl diester phosphodiesterase